MPAISPLETGASRGLQISIKLAIALLSIALISSAFCLQERIGINLGDEGFLWYGVQRVLAGEIPGRDFHAYEPGRYYWDAACLKVLRSDGLLQLRIANAAFATIGLFLGLLAVRMANRSWFFLTLCGAILVIWLFPRHKIFEHSIAMTAVFVATELIRRPTLRRHALTGAFVGIAEFFGSNHGLYTGISLGLTAIYVYLRVDRQQPFKRAVAFSTGLILGLLPLIVMFMFVPGFWSATTQSIVLMIHGTQSQQPLPIPWPWRPGLFTLPIFQAAFEIGTGFGFLLMPALFGTVLIWSMAIRKSAIQSRALVIGSAFVGLTYAHHAFSRADFSHLAQAMHPALLCAIGLIALTFKAQQRVLAVSLALVLIAFTTFTALRASPFAEYRRTPASQRATMHIDGQMFCITTAQKQLLTTLHQQVAANVKPGESFAAAPLYPFAYPFMHARSPWWDIYHLFARDTAWQQRMIQDLNDRRVTLILLSTDIAVDGREELKFPNADPLVWQYIQLHYTVEGPPGGSVDPRYWHLIAPQKTQTRDRLPLEFRADNGR